MSATGRLGRDVLLRVTARVGASAMQAATLLLLARLLGPDSFGVFAIFFSIGSLLTALVTAGAGSRLLRVLADDEQEGRKLAPALFWIQLTGCVVILIGMVAAAPLSGSPAAALLGTAVAISDHQVEWTLSYLSGLTRQATASVLILIQRAAALVAVVVATRVGAVYLLLGLTAAGIWVLAVVLAPTRRTQRAAVVSALRTSMGYWSLDIVPNLRQLEPVVVAAAGGTTVTGLYAIASRVINPLLIFVASLQVVIVPELAKATGTPAFRKIFRLLVLLSSLYGALLILTSPLIATVFIDIAGSEYEPARLLVTIMVICAALSAVSQAFQAKLLVLGEPAKPAWIVGSGTVAGLVLLGALAGLMDGKYIWIAPLTTQVIIVIAMALVATRRATPAVLAVQAKQGTRRYPPGRHRAANADTPVPLPDNGR